MYLSKLDIFGFKSFAQKTQLKFNDGIACLIGPNGSGKSNIVDAIRWVLGEQKVSTLRTDRMESVIFNGTHKRSPLGIAEVSLTIQNNKNIIQSPFTEVVITRRLYRSGESHYLLNKMPCRLKDIQDLFMDTGMGSDSYSVIELKMVESIISENPSERRHLFEEAAGITKYKFRRKSAIRKMETTQQDMSRISDLIAEINRTVNSLSRQVGKARHYLHYKDDLKKLETDLARYRYTRFLDDINILQKQLEEVHLIKEDTSQQITLEEALLEDYKREIIQTEENLRKFNEQLYQTDEQIHQLKEEEAVTNTRTLSIHENTKRNNTDIEEYQQKIQHLQEFLKESQGELQRLQSDFNQQTIQFNELDQNYQFMAETLKQTRQMLEQESKTAKGMFEELNNKKETVQEKNFQLKINQDKVHAFNLESRQKLEREQEIDARLLNLQSDQMVREQERDNKNNRILACRNNAASLENRILTAKEHLKKLEAQLEFIIARIHFFEQVISRYEGHAQSTRFVMTRRIEFPGLHGPLADFLQVDDRLRPAFEAALGDMLDYLVVEDVETAKILLQQIEQGNHGRVTCIPLSRTNKLKIKDGLVPAGLQALSELINCPDKYKKIFSILLGDRILVSGLEDALPLAEEYPEFGFVTMKGEIVTQSHLITGGASHSSEFSLLGRRDQLEKVREEKIQVESDMEKIRAEIGTQEELLFREQENLSLLQTQLEALLLQIKELERDELQLRYEKDFLQQNHDRRTVNLKDIEEEVGNLQKEIEHLASDIAQRQEIVSKQELHLTSVQGDFDKKNVDLQILNQMVQESRIQQETQKNHIANTQAEIERTGQAIRELNEQILKRETEIRTMQEQLQQLAERKLQLEQEKARIWESRDQIEKEKDSISQQYHAIRDKILNLENQIKRFRKQHDTSLERSRQLELNVQELQMKSASLKDRIQDEYNEDISIGIAFDQLNTEESQQQIDHLKYKISQLGQVNPLAVSEYDKEKERLDFYTKQYEDLVEAEKSLRETIKKINVTARQQFLTTFDQIKQNFEQIFNTFFENGEGALALQEDSDPLEANIEILVRPKGKRLQTINLLSGGEKTLTAISLLFAIYLVKPSPFCILDEIDAPLDDVNINRFTKALRDFSKDTQFIVVTHNKRTMEAANTLYGVTMEEEGLSKIVSVKFN